MRDPFTRTLEQRRRKVPDSIWFPLTLVVAGLANLLLGRNDWPWWALADLAAVVVGGALLVRVVRRRISAGKN